MEPAYRRGRDFWHCRYQRRRKSTSAAYPERLNASQPGRVNVVTAWKFRRWTEKRYASARQRIGMIFQHFNLAAYPTVAQTLRLA